MWKLLSWDKLAIAAVVVIVAIFGAYKLGYFKGWADAEAKWTLEAERQVAAAKLEAAELRANGEQLAAQLVEAKAKIRVETVETVREVVKYVRPKHEAIDGRITSLLNSMSGIRERTERTVYGPDGTTQTTTTTATDSGRPVGSTSEKGIVEWAMQAIGMYETCRQTHMKTAELLQQCAGQK